MAYYSRHSKQGKNNYLNLWLVWVWMKLSQGKQLVMMADKQELEIKLLVKSSSQSKKLQKCEKTVSAHINSSELELNSSHGELELRSWWPLQTNVLVSINQTISKMSQDKIYFKKALKL